MKKMPVLQLKNNICVLEQHGDDVTLIDENGNKEVLHKNGYELIDEACIYHGSSLKGRSEAINRNLNIKQKSPILISEVLEYMYFPILSYMNENCIWINYNAILKVSKIDGNHSKILFLSGYTYELTYNVRMIRNQMKRCDTYLKLLREHKF